MNFTYTFTKTEADFICVCLGLRRLREETVENTYNMLNVYDKFRKVRDNIKVITLNRKELEILLWILGLDRNNLEYGFNKSFLEHVERYYKGLENE